MANDVVTYVPVAISVDVVVGSVRVKTLEPNFSHFQVEYGRADVGPTPPVADTTDIKDVMGTKDANGLYWEMNDFILDMMKIDTYYAYRFRVVDMEGNVGDWYIDPADPPVITDEFGWVYDQVGNIVAPEAPASITIAYAEQEFNISFSYNFDTAQNTDCKRFEFAVFEDNAAPVDITSLGINAGTAGMIPNFIHSIDKQAAWDGSKLISYTLPVKKGVTYTVFIRSIDWSDNASDWVEIGANRIELRAPFPESLIDEYTTALLPYDLGYESTDGLYPVQDTMFPIRTDGHYGGCLECFETPSNVLEYCSMPNIMDDFKSSVHKMKSYSFATDDYLSIPHDADLDMETGDFTLSICINPSSVSGTQYLINKEDTGVGYGLYMVDDDLYIRFDDGTTDVSAIIGTACFSVGLVTDIWVSFDRSGDATAYVNNDSVGTVAISTANLTLNNAGALKIGCTTAGANFFNGIIYEYYIYNCTLTQSEITQISQSGQVPFKYVGASQTAKETSDFTVNVDNYNNGLTKATQDGNQDAVSDGVTSKDNCLRISVTDTRPSFGKLGANFDVVTGLQVGKMFKLDLDYYIPSASTGTQILFSDGSSSAKFGGSIQTLTKGTWTHLSINTTTPSISTKLLFDCINFVNTDIFYLVNIVVTQIGCVGDWNPSGIFDNIWYDSSGNNLYATNYNYGATVVYDYADTYDAKFFFGGDSISIPAEGLYYESDFNNFVINNLVTNPEFETATGDPLVVSTWVSGNSGLLYQESNGYKGKCLKITDNGAVNNPYAYQVLTTKVGYLYTVEVYVKEGTEASYAVNIGTSAGGTQLLASGTIESSSTWEKYQTTFLATTTTSYLSIWEMVTAASKYIYFDSIKVYESAINNYLISLHDKIPTSSICNVNIFGQEVIKGEAYGTQSADHLIDGRQSFAGVVAGDLVKNLTTGYGYSVSSKAVGNLTLTPTGTAFTVGDEYEVITHRGSDFITTRQITGTSSWEDLNMAAAGNQYDNRFIYKIIPDPDYQTDKMYVDYAFGLCDAATIDEFSWDQVSNLYYPYDYAR